MKPSDDDEGSDRRPELEASDTSRSQAQGANGPDAPTVDLVPPSHDVPDMQVVADDTSPSNPTVTVDAVPKVDDPPHPVLSSGANGTLTLDPGATVDPVATGEKGRETVPSTVAGYEILAVLGRGAMGVVYKARQRGLQRLVALKMILSGEHASEHEMGRFQGEANAVAQLQHPNIVQIYEVGEDAGRPFFSLEFVDGLPLDRKIRGTLLAPEQSAILMRQLAEAMAYAHQHGVIHRDLKPANVLLTSDGMPKIGDFGLAKRLEEKGSALTQSGAVVGTPSYMSPEQASGRGDQVGPLSDVYSLGAILYELLTGRPPFRGTSILDTLHQLRTREPISPGQLQPGVPRDLETICSKCLQKEPAKRYASAGELAADLKRFLAGEPILARPIGRPERVWRWCKRNPRAATASAVFVLTIVGWAVSASALAWQLGVKNHEAEVARRDADENAAEAQNQKGIAETNLELARINEELNRQTADRSIKALIEMGSLVQRRLQSKSTQASPEVKQLRTDTLADLREHLAKVSKTIQGEAPVTFADVRADQMMGDLLKDLGKGEEAKNAYRRAHAAVQERVAKEPDDDKARANLGVMESRLGDVARELEGDARTALVHYQKAHRLHETVRTAPSGKGYQYKDMEIRLVLAHDDMHLGWARLALGQPAAARDHFSRALATRMAWAKAEPKNASARSYVMEARMWLGTASWHLGDAQAVHEHLGEALKIGKDLLREFPRFAPFRADMAEVFGAHGDAFFRLGKSEAAEQAYRESLRTLKEGIGMGTDGLAQQLLLALTHERLGIILDQRGKPTEAKELLREALRVREDLLHLERNNPLRQMAYLVALARSGKQAEAAVMAAKVRPQMEKSTELMLQVARVFAPRASGDAAVYAKALEQSLAALELATRTDFGDATALLTDPDLAGLRKEARFEALIARIKAR